ncbi:MAG: prolyl aminopeptidase [Rhodospirillaceae bacterium]|nr:prolyl aminopeptidase [Rhodospirillaceae bacterium]
MDSTTTRDIYPHIEPYQTGMLDVGDGQRIYYETSGNPDGMAVIFLHGGPGAGSAPSGRRFFNPERYRIILFDQRGSGKSSPKGSVVANTTQHLISDIEILRLHLGVKSWLVFGGSWGATLALAYGEAHPDRCLGFILRGVFLGEQKEIDWFLYGMEGFFPEAWAEFSSHPGVDSANLLSSYLTLLNNPDPQIHLPAARAWANYENSCSTLLPNSIRPSGNAFDSYAISLARIEANYFAHSMFLSPNQLLGEIGKITHLPATIVQGRYDVICPISSAHKLAQAWPGAVLDIVPDGGHSAMEQGIRRMLTRATDQFMPISG